MASPVSQRPARRHLARQVGMSGNYWYAVELDQNVRRGQVREVTFWHTSMALFRGADGVVRALENRCAHRHLRLTEGRVEGNALTCAYHGWTYDGCGTCIRSHATRSTGRREFQALHLRSYPVRCKYGLIWLFPGDPGLADTVPLPSFPVLDTPRPWPFVPLDMTIKAHFSMVVENVCDFNHAYLHRKFKLFVQPQTRALWRDGDTVYVDYDSDFGQGHVARTAGEQRGQHLDRIKIWYQYPYQGSDLQGKYLHWLYLLPIDARTTRCFFLFVFGPMEIPYIGVNIPFGLRQPLLHLLNRVYLRPLLGQDKWALEEEQRAHQQHAGKPSYEFNPLVPMLQQLTVEKWREYVASERARLMAVSATGSPLSSLGAGLTGGEVR